MSKKIVAFHSYQLGERGTEIHMYKNAKYNKEILGNESIIISTSSRPTPTLKMFQNEFDTILYPDVWISDGINKNLRTSLERICDDKKVSHFWATKGGESDGIFPSNATSIAACIFQMKEPHGDIYSGICKYISDKHGGTYSYVYPIVEKECPEIEDNFREEFRIPKDAIVFGRHGGRETFNIPFIYGSIIDALNKRNDIYFLFLNTDIFIKHDRVIHIPWTCDMKLKAKFVNTCDAMLHARTDGEIFSLSIAEFSTRNKPIITWKPDIIPNTYDTGHFYVLENNAIYYKDQSEIKNILLNIQKSDIELKNWDVYSDKYSPKNIMDDFDKKYLI